MMRASLPKKWYWLSFVDVTGFLGGCMAQAEGFMDAIYQCWDHGCNPGGSVKAYQLPDDDLGPFEPWRLYSREEINSIDGAIPWTDSIDDLINGGPAGDE